MNFDIQEHAFNLWSEANKSSTEVIEYEFIYNTNLHNIKSVDVLRLQAQDSTVYVLMHHLCVSNENDSFVYVCRLFTEDLELVFYFSTNPKLEYYDSGQHMICVDTISTTHYIELKDLEYPESEL